MGGQNRDGGSLQSPLRLGKTLLGYHVTKALSNWRQSLETNKYLTLSVIRHMAKVDNLDRLGF